MDITLNPRWKLIIAPSTDLKDAARVIPVRCKGPGWGTVKVDMDVVIMAHLAPEEKGGYTLNGELWETG